MNEIEHTIFTGYPTNDYIDYERRNADMTPLDEQVYDDAKDFFKDLFVMEEVNNGNS